MDLGNEEIFHEHMIVWSLIWYGYYLFIWLLLPMNSHILPKQKEDREYVRETMRRYKRDNEKT